MKFAHILPLSALAALTAASPLSGPQPEQQQQQGQKRQDTYTPPPTINFATFKVPHCALNTASHIESHGSIENGKCIFLDWSRSIAYKADFPHTTCVAKFYTDSACSPGSEIAAGSKAIPALGSGELIDNYYPACWDDVSVLNTWGGVYEEDLVPLVNVTVTCT